MTPADPTPVALAQAPPGCLEVARRLGLKVDELDCRTQRSSSDAGQTERRPRQDGMPVASAARVTLGRRSSAIALDIDADRHGDRTFTEFQQRRGRFALPDTVTVLGASGRRYLYFGVPSDVTVPSAVDGLGFGIDVRGEGARGPWPPSVDSMAEPYRLCAEAPLALAPLPGDVLRRLQKRARPTSSAAARLDLSRAPHHEVARARAEGLGRVRSIGDVSTLSIQALLLGRLVGFGYLDLAGVALDLAAAAQRAGLDPGVALPAIRDGLAAGADLERPGSLLTVLNFFAAPHGQPHVAVRRDAPSSNPTIKETP